MFAYFIYLMGQGLSVSEEKIDEKECLRRIQSTDGAGGAMVIRILGPLVVVSPVVVPRLVVPGVPHTHSQPLQQQTASAARYNINTWGSAHPRPTAATAKQHQQPEIVYGKTGFWASAHPLPTAEVATASRVRQLPYQTNALHIHRHLLQWQQHQQSDTTSKHGVPHTHSC